jgi:hypothetical protein
MNANKMDPQSDMATCQPHEDVMTLKFPAVNRLLVLLAAAAVIVVGLGATQASAQTAVPITDRADPTRPTSRARTPASTSPSVPGSMPASRYCRVTANSPITRFRLISGIPTSRAKITIARSTASRSARLPTWADIRAASRFKRDGGHDISSGLSLRSHRVRRDDVVVWRTTRAASAIPLESLRPSARSTPRSSLRT